MELQPCGGCRRHVAVGDSACPFCGRLIDMGSDPSSFRPRPLLGKVSRAAVFAVGASTAACWTSSSPGTTTGGGGGGGGDQISNKGSGQPADDLPVPAPATGFAAIYGICTDSATGQPLAGVNIMIFPESGPAVPGTKSDARGRYLANVAPGKYSMQFWGPRDPQRMAPPGQYVELRAGEAKRLDVHVDNRDWSNVPMPYGAPPQRRRVV